MNKILVTIGFAVTYLVAVELTYDYDPISPNRSAFLWLGLILGSLSLLTFMSSGSRKIVFSSVLSFGHLVLIAAPAIYIGVGNGQLRSYLKPSSALLFLSLIFVVQLGLFVTSQSASNTANWRLRVDGSFQILALAVLVIAFVANRTGGLAHAFGSLALAAVVLASLVTFTRPTVGRAILHGIFLLMIISFIAVNMFDGNGRLEFASYLLSIGVMFSWVINSYLIKVGIVLASVPAYFMMTRIRVETIQRTYGMEISGNDTLVSVFGPFQSGAYILQQAITGEISPTHGQSWLTSLLFWVPRSAWPGKPPGFGRAIVSVTQPQNVHIPNHSDAAPYLAEFVWDFGMLGLLLMPVLIWLIFKIDRWILSDLLTAERTWVGRNPAFLAACVAAISGMMINFGWGASFTFMSRTALPALLILGLYWVSAMWNTAPKTRSEPADLRVCRPEYPRKTVVGPYRLPSRWLGGETRTGFHTGPVRRG